MTEPEFYYEWGWVARFENGEEWDSNDGLSEDKARWAVEVYSEEDQRDFESGLVEERVFYSLRKRRVAKAGPWEEVE